MPPEWCSTMDWRVWHFKSNPQLQPRLVSSRRGAGDKQADVLKRVATQSVARKREKCTRRHRRHWRSCRDHRRSILSKPTNAWSTQGITPVSAVAVAAAAAGRRRDCPPNYRDLAAVVAAVVQVTSAMLLLVVGRPWSMLINV